MTSRRVARLSQAIREQVSTSILFDLKDPRVNNVTVTGVDVSPDATYAKITVSVLGDEKDAALCLHGLNSARGYLQSKVATRIKTRNTPILAFEIDKGVKRSIEVSKILRDTVSSETEADEAITNSQSPGDDGDIDGPDSADDSVHPSPPVHQHE